MPELASKQQAPLPLTSTEMKALSGVVMMECTKEYRKIVDYTRMGKMPDFESQENLMACWGKTYNNSVTKCNDEYLKLLKCLDTHEKRSLKCADLRGLYEERYVKSVIIAEEK